MKPYKFPSSGNCSPRSPPASPRPRSRSPRYRHRSGKPVRPASKSLAQRLGWLLLSLLLKRQGLFLFAPLLYLSVMLFYMGTVPYDIVPVSKLRHPPGSLYRSPQLYAKLRSEMDSDNSSVDAISTIWKNSYKGGEWRPCIKKSSGGLPESNGYIYVEANGGLNQQRTSICNAVAVAAYLNATLIIPYFHFHSIWRDSRIIRLSPFANRLSTDAPPAVQRLRCLTNYQALNFSDPISTLGKILVERMKKHSAKNGGKYVSVHLRFEEDMVAFSCCVYDGGEQEKIDMDAARERGWKGKFTKPGRIIIPGAIRLNGSCPLTPLEVGLMLRGMGFGKSTSVYLASGKIYNYEKYMAPLLEMFPLLQTKETLASAEELAPFKNYSSRMAAIDYTVCLHSEVFVPTQGGNFLQVLLGHRRYLYGGHSRTIRPDKRKLAVLFDNPNIGWKNFKKQMVNMRANSVSKGLQLKRASDSIYSFPCPDCMCKADKSEDARSPSVT
ncbi:protein ESMERALDA 1-like isoform X2 [Salvia miltiorrhiza]|uniref:protein ESMERALDA 1-like isoform X2 n=1 Tax=Salvia miltiorrhiza TaxID=226208 RepID=UPI0025AD63AA|nr:protein ESMERALDA 1-like isoform X2 [Salvia miltiorrhiza]